MQRKIKFRAWNKDEKEMYYDAEQTYDHRCQGTGCFSGSFGSVLEDERFEVMQYTGLKDKNGKEIYEGDIVKIIVNNNIEKTCVIEYKNGIFGVMFSKQAELSAFPHFHNTTFEVIGNIYDNPELLGD